MATGTTTVDFGAWPGSTEASVVVTGQAGIVAGSFVEAWLVPTATADHSADEHRHDGPRIVAGTIVAATGFTIYAHARDLGGLAYGLWTVAWVWV